MNYFYWYRSRKRNYPNIEEKKILLARDSILSTVETNKIFFPSDIWQMSNNENWNHPYLLTLKLYKIIDLNCPNSQNFFSVQNKHQNVGESVKKNFK